MIFLQTFHSRKEGGLMKATMLYIKDREDVEARTATEA